MDNINYSEDMFLRSASGFAMPFEARDKDVTPSLGYGRQINPVTGQQFMHAGYDFDVSHYVLLALADGQVVSISSNMQHGNVITCRYGRYDVTYGHVSNVFVSVGELVKAAQPVAISGDMLHFEVSCDGRQLDPAEFLAMLYGNVSLQYGNASQEMPFQPQPADALPDYDNHREEIERLLTAYLPAYLQALQDGRYHMQVDLEKELRTIMQTAGEGRYFYEKLPSYFNPMGIGERSKPLAARVQTILYRDFINYMSVVHGFDIYQSSTREKKKI